MTDKVTPRELPVGRAVSMLRALEREHDDVLNDWLETGKAEITERAAKKFAKRRESILSRVHPSAREIVQREAGGENAPPLGFSQAIGAVADSLGAEEDGPPVEYGETKPLTRSAGDVPRGVTPYVPGPVAQSVAERRR